MFAVGFDNWSLSFLSTFLLTKAGMHLAESSRKPDCGFNKKFRGRQ